MLSRCTTNLRSTFNLLIFNFPKNQFKFSPNLTFSKSRFFHLWPPNQAKLFIDTENAYAYTILPPIPKFTPCFNPPKRVETPEQFLEVLNQNWRESCASDIVEAFERVKDYCVGNNIDLSDPRFDKLVDGLMDHCEKLTDEELLRLLILLTQYPQCDSSTTHNYHDVWSCLDDVCCWKMANWNFQKLFTFAEIWYRLNLGRLSDFIFEVIDKSVRKSHRLPKEFLVYICFYLNVARKKEVPFDFEHTLATKIGEFNVEELTIVAMAYFKSKSKVKLKPILDAMIRAVNSNCDTINEISLTAILKTIRLSQHVQTADEIPPLLDNLLPQIPRLSKFATLHIALLGTSLQIKHEKSLMSCTQAILDDIENVRLKDLERILLVCSMFNIDTKPCIFNSVLTELKKEHREKEMIQYRRSLGSTLHYLTFRQIYPFELINKVLDDEYISEVYGKSIRNLPRELFSLDCSLEIECQNYSGNRLDPSKKFKSVKWLTEYTPSHTQHKRLTLSDKLYLEVAQYITSVVGQDCIRHYHVLPHFSKSDIIVCRDMSGNFVEPKLDQYVLGDIMRPCGDFDWFAFIVMTPNLTVRGRNEPLGSMVMKARQLRSIGFRPIFVYSNEFRELGTENEKMEFVKTLLNVNI
ncbi:FAST kinase domain-containing protein 5, mitochondrial [Tribolium madens]|uniref:FAST kinase domain-containing protein 5, mitochondrial n=1 Tax=Tribolium madens TaxID=41895 RepID=UPI001CF72759|nr:FAST kinase domain-containing protein 5, mitochondrial [Tribolium madens]